MARAIAVFGGAPDPDDRRVYLCHLYCELGATSAKSAFRELHDWLRVNPNEVIILVLEDHVEAEDAVEVLESSGLADRAYAWVAGSPAPTMRQLIETKKNVDHAGGEPRWRGAALVQRRLRHGSSRTRRTGSSRWRRWPTPAPAPSSGGSGVHRCCC